MESVSIHRRACTRPSWRWGRFGNRSRSHRYESGQQTGGNCGLHCNIDSAKVVFFVFKLSFEWGWRVGDIYNVDLGVIVVGMSKQCKGNEEVKIKLVKGGKRWVHSWKECEAL
jgi:hypothetical protein